MRFCYAESMTDPSFYAPLARAAEAAGFDSMMVPDSICYPRRADSRYPFNPDGSREFLEDKPFLEPFSLIPALGAVTRRLRFITFVLKLPVRHPVRGGDHGVLERPRPAGLVAVDGDLRLAGRVHGDHVRSELGAQERDDLVPAGELQRLAVHHRAVVHRGIRREHLGQVFPQLQVDAAQVAVFHLADLFERDKVHVPSLVHRIDWNKNLF